MIRLFLFLLLLAPAWAALPPQSPEDLAERASYVLEGEVLSVSSETKSVKHGTDRHYTIKIKVTKWLKSETRVGDPVTIFCKTTETRPNGWAGPQGQNDVPEKGDSGTFYLSSGFKLLEPNGWTRKP